MGCADLHTWYLRHRLPVINIASNDWERACREIGMPSGGASQKSCFRRLVWAGVIRHLRRGLYLVVDPVREAPAIAIASASFAHVGHYVTTDAALAAQSRIDQPIPVITVVVAKPGSRRFDLGGTTIRPVAAKSGIAKADVFVTTRDGFEVRVATPVQAVADALAEPAWMTHNSLIPEVLREFSDVEVDQLAKLARQRSQAAAARLGFLLEDAGRQVPLAIETFRPTNVVSLVPGRANTIFSSRWRVKG